MSKDQKTVSLGQQIVDDTWHGFRVLFEASSAIITSDIGLLVLGALISIGTTWIFDWKTRLEADKMRLQLVVYNLLECHDTFIKAFEHFYFQKLNFRSFPPQENISTMGVQALYGPEQQQMTMTAEDMAAIKRSARRLNWSGSAVGAYLTELRDEYAAYNTVINCIKRYEETKQAVDEYTCQKETDSPLAAASNVGLTSADLNTIRRNLIIGEGFMDNIIHISAKYLERSEAFHKKSAPVLLRKRRLKDQILFKTQQDGEAAVSRVMAGVADHMAKHRASG